MTSTNYNTVKINTLTKPGQTQAHSVGNQALLQLANEHRDAVCAGMVAEPMASEQTLRLRVFTRTASSG
ncbi:hypothetical protein KBY80_12920 [Synechococcus sp. JJ3a-Johnson]|uniref:hypothetical protein n=1 Tax=unclassified Synechococcus TaxID=2626047 RepID=UPI0020CE4786|nr:MULTISPECIES: hypothetical protein [unclassified Synechococcus]MCP9832275.1 hypothetical protein [Synechococcus sp. JJ3a-Johnson]